MWGRVGSSVKNVPDIHYEDLNLIPRTHVKKLDMVINDCNPNLGTWRQVNLWSSLASSSLVYLVTSRPVRDPDSERKADGT